MQSRNCEYVNSKMKKGKARNCSAPLSRVPSRVVTCRRPQMVTQIATYLRGWLGYFNDCQTPSVLQTLESWLRRRLRSVVWKQWKRGRTRFRELRKRNVSQDLAAQTAGSPHGPWRIANSPALAIALPNAYFAQLGLPPMVVRFWLNPPNRRMRTRMYGGVAREAGRPVPLCRLINGLIYCCVFIV